MTQGIKTYYDQVAYSFENAYSAETIYCDELKNDMLVDLQAITKAIGKLSAISILDLGCGTGYWSRIFCNRSNSVVTGVDISQSMGRLFRKNQPTSKYICADIFEFTQNEKSKYDVIICSFILSHYDSRLAEILLKRARRLLNSGGCIVLTDSSWSKLRLKVSDKEIYKVCNSAKVKKYYRSREEFEKIVERSDLMITHSYFGMAFFNYIVAADNEV